MVSDLFEIVYILLAKKKQTAAQLASHFNVSTRTIFRWIEQLSETGIPLYMTRGKGGGISIMDGYVLDTALFSDIEKKEILSSIQALQNICPVDSALPGTDAVGKLAGIFKLNNSETVNWVDVEFSGWGKNDTLEKTFALLKKAIIKQCTVRFSYFNIKGEKTEREIEPWQLVFRLHTWYVSGFCLLRSEARFFKLRRITGLQLTAKKCVHPVVSMMHSTEGINYSQEAGCDLIAIKFRIKPKSVFRAWDDFPPENIAMQEDGSAVVSTKIPDNDQAYYYLAGFGSDMEIIEPKSVRNKIIRILETMLQHYRHSPLT